MRGVLSVGSVRVAEAGGCVTGGWVYNWVKRYTDKTVASMWEYPAHTSSEWVVDEVVLDVGGHKYWNWNAMDAEMRYILASHLSLRGDDGERGHAKGAGDFRDHSPSESRDDLRTIG